MWALTVPHVRKSVPAIAVVILTLVAWMTTFLVMSNPVYAAYDSASLTPPICSTVDWSDVEQHFRDGSDTVAQDVFSMTPNGGFYAIYWKTLSTGDENIHLRASPTQNSYGSSLAFNSNSSTSYLATSYQLGTDTSSNSRRYNITAGTYSYATALAVSASNHDFCVIASDKPTIYKDTVDANGVVIPPYPVPDPFDLCANLSNRQATIPEGYQANESGDCEPIPAGDPGAGLQHKHVQVMAATLAFGLAALIVYQFRWRGTS